MSNNEEILGRAILEEQPLPKELYDRVADQVSKMARFQVVQPIYDKFEQIEEGGNVRKKKYRLIKVKETLLAPPMFVIDEDSSSCRKEEDNYLLFPMTEDEIRRCLSDLPVKFKRIIEKALDEYSPSGYSEEQIPTLLYHYKVLNKLKPSLSEELICQLVDYWSDIVDNILSNKKVPKDQDFLTIAKTHLLCGVNPKVENHTICSTNTNVGKSGFYRNIGILFDRMTKPSIFGTVREGVHYPGALDGAEEAVCIDNMEANEEEDLIGYCLGLMEEGIAKGMVGALPYTVVSKCPIIFASNPPRCSGGSMSLDRLLLTLTRNPHGAGKRFGTLLIGNDFASIPNNAPNPDIFEWMVYKTMFRTVENYVRDFIIFLHFNKTVENQVFNYNSEKLKRDCNDILRAMVDDSLKSFLSTFILHSHKHRNGGALDSAIVDFIPDLVQCKREGRELPNSLINEIINRAKEYIPELDYIQIRTINERMNTAITPDDIERVKRSVFDSFPKAIQYVIEAVRRYKQAHPNPERSISFEALEQYKPEGIQYWSRIKNKIEWQYDVNKYRERLHKYYRFTITESRGLVMIVFD